MGPPEPTRQNSLKLLGRRPRRDRNASENFPIFSSPTHRIQHVFLTLPHGKRDMFQMDLFKEMFELIGRIKNLTTSEGVKLDDICYKPLGKKYGCAIMSPTNYFQVCQFLNRKLIFEFLHFSKKIIVRKKMLFLNFQECVIFF